MEDHTALLADAMHQDPFGTVMRGYDRRQVNEYMARARTQIRDLEDRLAHALREVEESRRELVLAQEQYTGRPAHEEVSERLSQILRLAAEEAEQERSKADEEIAQMREIAEQEIGTLVQEAREESDQILAGARDEAERMHNHASEESQRLLESSRAEAEHVLSEATDHAERLRRQGEHRASVVNGVLSDRLAALTDAHGLAVRRLAEIRDTVTDLLHSENEAGPLAAALSVSDPATTGAIDVVSAPGSDVAPGAGAVEPPGADAIETVQFPAAGVQTARLDSDEVAAMAEAGDAEAGLSAAGSVATDGTAGVAGGLGGPGEGAGQSEAFGDAEGRREAPTTERVIDLTTIEAADSPLR